MTEDRRTRRLLRRETHSSRSVPSVLTAVVVLILLLWLFLETALSVTGAPPILLSPVTAAQWLADLPRHAPGAVLAAAGLALALVGLLLLALALLPGNRPRYVVTDERSAIIVDYEVVASAASRVARTAAAVSTDQVHTWASRRRIEVQVHPTSGLPVDEEAVRRAVERELASYELDPMPAVTVEVSTRGAVGV
ncbi:hypothetical protein GCM10011512_01600 [Tersicoccus solisilvae]|uniref:DUF6286 domain-containing protein n=1 Tax=Tersicoccus solisilvae TaxID=1882339 RepID=A0ABQ1NJY9_9MICC|nr:DUF6286 domain-containing protein [Tersicoccus solisilvae]GGC78678.1 hypothetical protein GCM10011512_01600 [Tersicoccus solisilvae]